MCRYDEMTERWSECDSPTRCTCGKVDPMTKYYESMYRDEAYRAWVAARKAEAVALGMIVLTLTVALLTVALW